MGAGAPNPLGLTDQLLQSAGLTTDDASNPADPIFKVNQLKLTQAKGYKVDAATVPGYKLDALIAAEGSTLPSVTEGDKTFYLISGVNGLQKFAHIVMGTKKDGSLGEGGSGADYSTDANLAACARLMADIHLTPPATGGSNWTPLGGNTFTPYIGTFDGQGHTVSGLVINRPEADNQGFFGYISANGSPATVKNLTVESTVTGRGNTGGIVGNSYSYSTITNCTHTGSVKGTSCVGGIAGNNQNSVTITACTNTGSVKGTSSTGGIAGSTTTYTTLTACTNTGSVTGTSSTGGVTGSNKYATIIACTNTGSVTSTGENTGGVTGYNEISTLTACYNTGSVNGANKTGGIVGRSYDGSTITACYSTGSVTGNGDTGGAVGYNHTSTVSNCYWQSFGPGTRPNNGVGGASIPPPGTGGGGTSTSVIGPNAYNGDGTIPSWFAGGGNSPANKMNAALGNNPYRYVQNPAYPAALRAAEGKNYDTNVPPLLLKKVPAD
ncbi:GLUG motif-containing protein [Bacteroides sp. GD17]|uniref:GLUG motif-containing protein n=1 Tax=Bacteroides sp. GD17 TaxID=3139826 RepID=UPI0025D9C37E|nr:GLUG motif-containing protein [uncultured Bacteroides sp.]